MGGAPDAATALKLSDQSVPASRPATSANPTASAPASSSSNSRRLRPCANSAKAMSTSVHAISRSWEISQNQPNSPGRARTRPITSESTEVGPGAGKVNTTTASTARASRTTSVGRLDRGASLADENTRIPRTTDRAGRSERVGATA